MDEDNTIEAVTEAASGESSDSTDSSSEPVGDSSPKKYKSIREALSAHLKDRASAEPNEDATASPEAQSKAPAQIEEPILAPQSMTAEERAVWDALPAQAKKFLARRAHDTTADYSRKMQSIQEREKQLSEWGTLAEAREEATRLGLDPAQTYKTALAWEKAFRQSPAQAAREFLRAYGIDPRELVQGAEGAASSPQQVDDSRYLTRAEFEQMAREREQIATMQNNQSVVSKFMEGKPAFRDPGTASELEAAMEPIVLGLRQSNPSLDVMETLERAYNMVTRGDPRFSELLSKAAGREAAEKAQQKVEAARTASRQISGGPGGGTPQVKFKSRRDALSYFASQGS